MAQRHTPRSGPGEASRPPRRIRRLRVLCWRWRHLVAASALGLAAAVAVGATTPAPPPSERAVVLSSARPAGAVLRNGDLVVRTVPTDLLPDGALLEPEQLVGERLAVALPAGYPLADGVLVGPRLARGAPPGTVVVPVRLADRDVAELLGAGDRVDLLRAPSEGGPAMVVARDVLVMARPSSGTEDALGLATPGPALLLVAATPEVATLLVGVGAWDPISAVLVPDAT